MKVIRLNNQEYYENIVTPDSTPIYRNAKEVLEALKEEVCQDNPQEFLAIPYKCKPLLMDGYCLFELVSNTEKEIVYTFTGTAS